MASAPRQSLLRGLSGSDSSATLRKLHDEWSRWILPICRSGALLLLDTAPIV
jgi:hypothetical protein